MARLLLPMSMLSLLSIGAIFGFFYAWVCSTMWGLDATDPRTAIAAMQAMNTSVRNAVFFPAFFLTPIILAATAFIAARQSRNKSAVHFGLAAILYIVGALLVTATVNVPMNEALAEVAVPTDIGSAREIWQDYSASWQVWNLLRTILSGVCLILTGLAIYFLNSESA
ncbi:DUF1772 domain-containing protein [Ruegeria sp. MALMAid1280]|uniref:anthrone oxygenase family protein n=1 Tax=Ruegeria sp. MALMAid1280 TaxID=3411634 RepID=UPI003B9EAE13